MEIIADLRDDILLTLGQSGIRGDRAQELADDLITTIKRWCAKEPANDA